MYSKAIHEWFTTVATANPESIAIETTLRKVTFAELHGLSSVIAKALLSARARFGDVVAIFSEDHLSIISALIGSLKAGCPFVNISATLPESRIRMLVDVARPRFVLMDGAHGEKLYRCFPKAQIVPITSEYSNEKAGDLQPVDWNGDDFCYIFFTSGSTGRPKGIAGRLKGIDHFIRWELDHFTSGSPVRVSQLVSPGFDAFLRDVFVPLCSGGTLCIPDEEVRRDPAALVRWIGQAGINLVHTVPSVFRLLLENLEGPGQFRDLNTVLVSGEPLFPSDVRKWNSRLGKRVRVVNLYGPTETTMTKFFYVVTPEDEHKASVPIGKPMDGVRALLMDERGRPCPDGTIGEIHIRTPYRSLGYYREPELTNEVFIPNPFNSDASDLIYRTGDFARVLPSGDFEFIGRRDHQIKIRGMRVELGEIENYLRESDLVSDCVAVDRDDDSQAKYICCYLVLKSGTRVEQVHDWLSSNLPEYMVPSLLVPISELPRLPNGKIDRKSLPSAQPGTTTDAPPRTETEKALADLWMEVLHLPRVGIHDSFFQIGGHSLRAAQIAARIRNIFNVDYPLRALFDDPTIARTAARIEKLRETSEGVYVPPLRTVPRSGPIPVSFAQRRLWFIDQLEGSRAYNIPVGVKISGVLPVESLIWSLNEIVRRHEVLRTSLPASNGEPVQVISDTLDLNIELNDLSDIPEDELIESIDEIRKKEAGFRFNLSSGPLIRARVLKTAAKEHVLLVTMHHIVSDAWSAGVLIREFNILFAARTKAETPQLPPLELQYADFAAWQRGWLKGPVLEQHVAFWKERLEGIEVLNLPTDRLRKNLPVHAGSSLPFTCSAKLSVQLARMAQSERTTLFTILTAGFQLLLGRYSGQDDVCIGTDVANRNQPELELMIGFFVNQIVVRTRLQGNPEFREVVGMVRDYLLEAYSYQDLPFEQLVEEISPRRDLSRSPLFQVKLVLQNQPMEAPDFGDLLLEEMAREYHFARFDFTLVIQETPSGLNGVLEYSTDLFDRDTVQALLDRFKRVLEAVSENPSVRIRDVPLNTTAEERHLLSEWTGLCVSTGERCLHELFEEQVRDIPENIALTIGNRSLSYAELDKRANCLGHHLRSLGVGPDTVIAVCFNSCEELFIGILGILKAGAAYLPLDPGYPPARLEYMLSDSKAPILLTHSSLQEKLPPGYFQVICVDTEKELLDSQPSSRIPSGVQPANLAYVIYTSGSTGNPKGVMVTHRGTVNLAFAQREVFAVRCGSPVLQFASISFDASCWEWIMSLTAGGKLVLADRSEVVPGKEMIELLEREKIELLTIPPSALAALPACELPSLHTIVVAGEACPPGLVERWSEGRRFFDAYGPTETTVCTTISEPLQKSTDLNIGRPLLNTHLCLLDEEHQLAPSGLAGELCVSGLGLARGYLNRPDLTAEHFRPDPFSTTPGERMYCTGDRVRWRTNGKMEFLGRKDEQVKVRGFRIELGEIEAALSSLSGVRQCIAIVAGEEDGPTSQRIVAYWVPDKNLLQDEGALRSGLNRKLPDYMIPSIFVALEELPLTSSGKIDRKSLPKPGHEARVQRGQRTSIEEILLGIWNELGVHCDGRDDNFFDRGGHSLLATQVVSRVRDVFGIELPLRAIFEAPTSAEYSLRIEEAIRKGARAKVPPLRPAIRHKAIPLSFAQSRLWFLEQLEPGTALYNIPIAVRFKGPVDLSAVQRVIAEIVKRHEILRTCFPVDNGEPFQHISPAKAFPVPIVDLSGVPEPHAENLARYLAEQDARNPFDLAHGPLLRAQLLHLGKDDVVLLAAMHHIVSDGWSAGILVREFTVLCEAFRKGDPSPLSPLPIQYADYAVWQKSWLQGEILDSEVEYWKRMLQDVSILNLPLDRPRPAVPSHAGSGLYVELAAPLTLRLKQVARENGVTLFMVLLSAYKILLSRYSGQHDIAVGTDVANRNYSGTEDLIGFFVNQLVLRTNLEGSPAFTELLGRVRETTLGAYVHQDLPFEQLVEILGPERDLRTTPLYQTKLVLQNLRRETLQVGDSQLEPFASQHVEAKFDLTLILEESEGRLEGILEFATDLFERETMQRFISHFRMIAEQLAAAPEQRIDNFPLLTSAERELLLHELNRTSVPFSENSCIHEVFASQAAKHPTKVALSFNGASLTYSELNARANQLGHFIRNLGVGPDVKVAIYLERSVAQIVGLLGILKADSAYVPLDPSYPSARIAAMLADSEAVVVLTNSTLEMTLPVYPAHVICLDRDWDQIAACPADNPVVNSGPLNLAYVMYTSGSTGMAKGIMVPHAAVNRLIINTNYVDFRAEDRIGQLSNSSFDAATFEIWGALLSGATLIGIPPDVLLSFSDFESVLIEERITMIFLTTAFFNRLPGSVGRAFNNLRYVIFGGEIANPERVREMTYYAPTCRFVHAYGPTETTCFALTHPVARIPVNASSLPIGRPIANTRAYVLNEHGHPVPMGAPGELYLGGPGLARGYFNASGLTAEKFVPDAFSGEPGKRLYRTGDRVRWLGSGNVDFIGREDLQLKIRGFRIEPGEVEAVLARHPGVQNCIVVARDHSSGGRELVAYVVSHVSDRPPSEKEIKDYLRGHLPEYMVPTRVALVADLPLSPNGKVDRNALAKLNIAERASEDVARRAVPRTAVQEILASLWAQLLERPFVGVNENFFEMGGHSLLATQVVTRTREIFKIDLPLRVLFENPVLADFAAFIEQSRGLNSGAGAPAIVRVDRSRDLPLSFAQQRLWFIDRLIGGGSAYNVPFVVRLSGTIEESALQQTITEIVRRHEVLRTIFPDRNGVPVQLIVPPAPVLVKFIDLSALPEREEAAQALINQESRQPFDLQVGPLLRTMLLRLGPADSFLMVTLHHIISDGWSKSVMVREFMALYDAFVSGKSSPLPDLSIQYADFAVWQREWLRGPVLEKHLSYWRRQLQNVQVFELPTDFPRPAIASQRGALMQFDLSAELSAKVANLCRQQGVTLFMALFSAFQVLLGRYTAQDDITIGTVIANRNHTEIEDLIGFFVNSLALRVRLTPTASFLALLSQVRDVALGAYEHQDLPFELIVEELNPERTLSRTPLYQVLFAVQNTPREDFSLADARVSMMDTIHYQALVDLAFILWDTPYRLGGGIEYATDLYEAASMRRLLDRYVLLLETITVHPEIRLEDIALLTAAEQQQLVHWNATGHAWEGASNIIELFAYWVKLTPNSPAVSSGELCLSYAELNRRANQLAHYLHKVGVGGEERVALCIGRSIEMMVGILGILKAGAAYVPLDSSYPRERLGYMFADASVNVVVTNQRLIDYLPIQRQRVVCLDSDFPLIQKCPETDSYCEILPGHLAYLIYTSGSTGQPKGVMLTHEGANNLARAQQALYAFRPGTVILQFASLSFDAATWEWMMALLAGGKLVLPQQDVPLVGKALADVVYREHVEVLTVPPSVLASMPEGEDLDSLRTIVVAGEACPKQVAERWAPGRHFFDAYGPTEITVCATVSSPLQPKDSINIGRAIPNLQVWVVDSAGTVTGPGVVGELYVGGKGVARGYLNRPALTADRFVPDPFSGVPGARMYRTGDRVRWRNEGQLEFISRIDDQVKVRGYRIELGEIETVLRSFTGVQDAMAAVREGADGGRILAAYIVPRRRAPRAPGNSYALPNGMVIAHKNNYETEILYDEIFVRQTYLRNGIQLPADGCIFDVGANIGMFTLFASLKCSRGRVFAFEPVGPIFKDLHSNLQWCVAETRAFQIALSNRAGETEFTYFPRNAAMSARTDYVSPAEEIEVIRQSLVNQNREGRQEVLLEQLDEILAGRFEGEVLSCEMRRLSDVIREEGIDRIDLLKVDVERSELDVLLGIDEEHWPLIQQAVLRVHNRIANQSEHRVQEIRELLEQHGFDVAVDEDELLQGTNIYLIYARRSGFHVSVSSDDQSRIPRLVGQDILEVDALRSYVQGKLPAYMVPGEILLTSNLPRLPNRKLDRSKVPVVEAETASSRAVAGPRDGNETALIQIWSEVLKRDDIGIRDNFFQIGGSSLNSVAICSRISKLFNAKIPVRTIFDHPTVEAMAAYIRQGVSAALPSAVVPIRVTGSRTPIFCVHPGSGLPHCYLTLARHLGPDQPVYAIQSIGFKGDEPPLRDVKVMAARYIRDVRAVYPNGPYQILGWSMGVAPALEMACQLTECGATVSLLGMLDGGFVGKPIEIPESQWESEIVKTERELLEAQAKMYIPETVPQLVAMPQDEAVVHYLELAKKIEQIPEDVTADQFRHVLKVMACNKLAQETYVPRDFPGAITLFRTPTPQGMDPNYGLDKLAGSGVQVFEMTGSHLSFVYEPELAQLLLRATDSASQTMMASAL